MIPGLAPLLVFLLVTREMGRCATDVTCGVIPAALPASRHRTVDDGDRIRAIDGEFSWPGSNNISLVLLLQSLGVFEVLAAGKDASEDRVELRKACEERARKLPNVS